MKETMLEEKREGNIARSEQIKEQYMLEVDRAIEEKNQNIADRRYHKLQADLAMPQWLLK